jgi:hypothetical protein
LRRRSAAHKFRTNAITSYISTASRSITQATDLILGPRQVLDHQLPFFKNAI